MIDRFSRIQVHMTLVSKPQNGVQPSAPRTPYCSLLLLLVLSCFSSLHADWHFDDIPNILLNPPLHLNDLNPISLWQTFFAYPDQPGRFLRPVSNLSFALNWFFGQDRVFGYHLVNFLIHLITTFFLYHSCLLLLRTPRCAGKYELNEHSRLFIAGLATILWAVNPIQTQAITYIVQRMASLAAMFTIIGLWAYLMARLQMRRDKRSTLYFFGAVLSFLLSLGSKENAILFPVSLLLVEIIFLQPALRWNRKTRSMLLATCALVFIGTLLLTGPEFFQKIFNPYSGRDFTPWQRLLTEARILVFYLSLIFYPAPSRLSITHDISLSTGLFNPVSTLTAVLLLLSLFLIAVRYYKKFPLAAFAILFFLLNHLVESSIIPLELIFEHRNYLPSLFLFLPVAAGLHTALQTSRDNSRLLYVTLIGATIFVIFSFSLGTIEHNEVWRSERSLWSDSLKKAPRSARSYINLAHGYLYDDKNYQRAFELYFQSLDKHSPTPWKDRLRAYNNLGYIMASIGNYPKAINFYNQALAVSKDTPISNLNSEIEFNKIKSLWFSGAEDEAIRLAANLAASRSDKAKYLRLYGELLIARDDPALALTILRQALSKATVVDQEYGNILLDLALLFGRETSFEKAYFFCNAARQSGVEPIPYTLCLLEISLRSQRSAGIVQAQQQLLSQITWPGVAALLNNAVPEQSTFPVDYPLLKEHFASWLTRQE